jgi:hypothetical protein
MGSRATAHRAHALRRHCSCDHITMGLRATVQRAHALRRHCSCDHITFIEPSE